MSPKPILQVLYDSLGLVYLMLLGLLAPYEASLNHKKVSVREVSKQDKVIPCRKGSCCPLYKGQARKDSKEQMETKDVLNRKYSFPWRQSFSGIVLGTREHVCSSEAAAVV